MTALSQSASLLPVEQRQLLAEMNDTDAPWPKLSVVELFERRVAERPEAPAVVTSTESVSFGELGERVARLRGGLVHSGVRRGDVVALDVEAGWARAALPLAVLGTGAAFYVPGAGKEPDERAPLRVRLTVTALDALLAEGQAAPVASIAGDDVAYVVDSFDSGAHAAVAHAPLAGLVADLAARFGLGPDDRTLALSHAGSDLSVFDLVGVLALGGSVVVPAGAEGGSADWLRLLAEHGVTVWNSTPPVLARLVDHAERRGERLPGSLRLILLSREWIPLRLPEQVRELAAGPVTIVSLGGASEAGIWSTAFPVSEIDPTWKRIPIGRPLANQRVVVLNESLAPCPVWVAGRLYFNGRGLSQPHAAAPQVERDRFVEHPESGERLYRSSQFGRVLPDGVVELLGTEQTRAAIAGYEVDVRELEVLLAEHPAVREAVVVSSADDSLVAFLEVPHGHAPSADELRALLRGKISEYLLPEHFEALAELPVAPDGSFDRVALRTRAHERASSPPPAPASGAGEDADPTEDVGKVVAEVLGLSDVDPNANLLDLGASSAELIHVTSRVEQEFGFEVDIEEMLEYPYVSTLARQHEAARFRAGIATEGAAASPERAASAEGGVLLADPLEREAFKQARHDLRTDLTSPRGRGIELRPSVDPAPAGRSGRRTHRRFSPGPVPLGAVCGLLASLSETADGGHSRRWYPSAGGLYPVQVYVHLKTGRVDGDRGGTYYCDPVAQRLVQIAEGAEFDRATHAWINREIFDDAAFSLHLVADLAAIEPMYGSLSNGFCMYEAGAMGQLLSMVAPAVGLGLCSVGAMDFDQIRHLFALRPSHVVMHTLLGGGLDAGREPADERRTARMLERLDRVTGP